MQPISILKFGGSSISNNKNLKIVANKIIKMKKKKIGVVVVVSAQGKRTDDLLEQIVELKKIAKENNQEENSLIGSQSNLENNNDKEILINNKREIDSLLTIGEQESASKLSILLNEMGYKSVALNAMQAGIFTNSDFGKAKIIDINTTRILKELAKENIVIVTGFQGIDKDKNFTTLGRGGSDTSAVALAIKLRAEKCYIFSDVDGVYDADPNIIKNAEKLEQVPYSEMENAASEGAKVLCERSISLADKYNMQVIAQSTFNDNKGTIISGMEHYKIKMYIKNNKLFKSEINNGNCEKINNVINKINNLNIKIKNLSIQNNNDVIFIANEYFKDDIKSILKEENLNAKFTKISEISFVGTGISNNNEILTSLYKILRKYNYNLINDVLNYEMHANVISIFFNKIISNDILNDLINCNIIR